MTKAERKEVWIDQIKTARYMADEAKAKNPNDNGTCNFDSAMIKKEKWFTYDETIKIFESLGIPARKYRTGWILVGGIHGLAEKNTLWAKTFENWLNVQGFETSMYYQCD